VNFIQKIAMVGTLGEGFLLDAFFAGTLNKVSDFEIIFEFKIFFGHCWHPSFAGLQFDLLTTKYTNHTKYLWD
jgi:hypothetical protein